jgi:hypothetical protein
MVAHAAARGTLASLSRAGQAAMPVLVSWELLDRPCRKGCPRLRQRRDLAVCFSGYALGLSPTAIGLTPATGWAVYFVSEKRARPSYLKVIHFGVQWASGDVSCRTDFAGWGATSESEWDPYLQEAMHPSLAYLAATLVMKLPPPGQWYRFVRWALRASTRSRVIIDQLELPRSVGASTPAQHCGLSAQASQWSLAFRLAPSTFCCRET